MSNHSHSPLRDKMIHVLELHRKFPITIEAYVAAVSLLARYHQRAPNQLSVDDVRDFLRHLITVDKRAYSTCNQRIRVNCGKGHKDRYTLLSPRLLQELREYWRAYLEAFQKHRESCWDCRLDH